MAADVKANLTTKGDKYYVIVCFYTDDGRKQKWINTGLTVSGNHKREAQKRCQQLIFEYQEKLTLNNGQQKSVKVLITNIRKPYTISFAHTLRNKE